ncbi:MAG: hypothetical protein SFW36_01675, partial [Leptolyngbyaceae cyanobacterium bins.59]|nr:hypothetical protein [Leptolyngbyaceae cyanobacterium bins.59]
MSPKNLQRTGLVCCVLCSALLFVAYERYESNAKAARAINELTQLFPINTGVTVTPAMPTASKYALFFAVLSGVGGVACFTASRKS